MTTVSVMDQRLTVRSEFEEEQLGRVGEFVNQRIEEVRGKTGNAPTLTTALLACMNIANDYLRLKETNEAASQRIRQLISELDGGSQEESRISS